MKYPLAYTLEYPLPIWGKGIHYAHTKQKTNYKQKKNENELRLYGD